MRIIQSSIRFPVTTAVGVLLLILFGGLALFRIPIQLTPEVEEPQITVTTSWLGASPQEVEREIVDEQEEQLKSLEGLIKMESSSSDGGGSVILTFPVGTNINTALLKVANRLEQVPSYPTEADKPVIRTGGANEGAIAWFILSPLSKNGFKGDIGTLYDFVDDFIEPEFERVPGVANSNFFGGQPHEMHVIVDPVKLAARRVTINELAAGLERENRNFSGGDFEEGKRRYLVRTVGEYKTPEDIEKLVVAVRNGVPVYLRDVARVELGFREPTGKVFSLNEQVLAINAIRAPGANVLEVMKGLQQTVERLNTDLLAPRGLELVQNYDQTSYIRSAIDLVRQSLLIGGALAIIVLLLYLRSLSSTLIISVGIPISLIGAFLMMFWFGRTLNVVSLAGLAFAVGMVVDNSIVVLENIYRHRQMGKSRFVAAYEGATEVWGAVLASTLTTIAVFLPVVFMQEEVGQLFGDIAVAITCAVALSLIVSITVIPSLSARILKVSRKTDSNRSRRQNKLYPFRLLSRQLVSSVNWINHSTLRRLAVIIALTSLSLSVSYTLIPKTEYLPIGNQNFLFGMILPPPGYSLAEVADMRKTYLKQLAPLWESEPGSPEAVAQPGGGIEKFFFVAMKDRAFLGSRALDPMRVRELIPVYQQASNSLPGTLAVVTQASIFQSGIDQGRNIDIDFTGPRLDRLIELSSEAFSDLRQIMPKAQARPIPGLDLGNPEIQIVTHRQRAAELGLTNRDLGFTVSAMIDGAKASDFQYQGKEIDLTIKSGENFKRHSHILNQLPIATPSGQLVTLGSVAQISEVSGPVQINHRERERAITIRVTPDERTPLESAMETIENKILEPMTAAGKLGGLYRASLSGTADKLDQAAGSLRLNLILAVIITYLLLSALFESFLYPFVIMFSVPLAAMGGFLGLAAINRFVAFQALDTLTMLGFVILIGTVVNNAILIIHQSLNHTREEGLSPKRAIGKAVENRIRPIFMSVSTSVFGMLPLVIFPGAGSELYRGLGSVVIGGLITSTVFTLFLVPALFSLVMDTKTAALGQIRRLLYGKSVAPVDV